MTVETGVYCIRNLVNGKVYVGSAARSLKKRWQIHLHCLRKGTHHSLYLQRSYKKYGEENFEFQVLSKCLPDNCLKLEQVWIDRLKATDPRYGYNTYPVAGSPLGVKRPASVGEAVSKANRGRIASEETRAKMSKARKGRKLERSHVEKVAAWHRGRKRSPETIEKLKAFQARLRLQPDRSAKIKSSHWSKRPDAADIAKKCSRLGKTISVEARARMSQARRGKKLSDQHRANLAKGVRKYYENRRSQKTEPVR